MKDANADLSVATEAAVERDGNQIIIRFPRCAAAFLSASAARALARELLEFAEAVDPTPVEGEFAFVCVNPGHAGRGAHEVDVMCGKSL